MDDGRSRRISSDASPLGQCTENGFLDKEGAKLQEATKRSTRADAALRWDGTSWNLMDPLLKSCYPKRCCKTMYHCENSTCFCETDSVESFHPNKAQGAPASTGRPNTRLGRCLAELDFYYHKSQPRTGHTREPDPTHLELKHKPHAKHQHTNERTPDNRRSRSPTSRSIYLHTHTAPAQN